MTDQLAANVDLAVWLDYATDTLLTDRAELALQVATGWVQDACRQKLVPVVGDVVTLDVAPGTTELWLPERPVTAVTTVSILGVPLTSPTDWVLVEASRLRAKRWTYWPTADPVVVTYNHGYAIAPQTLRGVALAAAARILDNPASHATETVGGVAQTAAGTGYVGRLTADEEATLVPYMALEAVA
jgi:hypothetical protein